MKKVTIQPGNKTIAVQEGQRLYNLFIQAKIPVDTPCGGRGKCGKCNVYIQSETKLGWYQSCQITVTEDMQVSLKEPESGLKVLEKGHQRDWDPRSWLSQTEGVYVLAYDIGTTTVVGFLMEASTGKVVAVKSGLNPQHAIAADVISRCEYACKVNIQDLTLPIRDLVNEIAQETAKEAGISPNQIRLVSIVGNTSMHHLYLGINPNTLLKVPYQPAVYEGMMLKAYNYQLLINSEAKLIVLPNIAGFVGADTAAVLLNEEFDCLKELTLMLDIGTNGELVLGNAHRLLACSTAAGPAFEGANIQFGMRGTIGAIQKAAIIETQITFDVIGGGVAQGICGSGLIDLVAVLLEIGMIRSDGRIEKPDKLTHPIALHYRDRITKKEGQTVIILYPQEDGQKEIYLGQKDIRQIQLAKAAIHTGIKLLCKKMGVSTDEIVQLRLAGAFGAHIDISNACRIGLIPWNLQDKTVSIGNAAGEGAKLAALSQGEYDRCVDMVKQVEFLELAADQEFQQQYFQNLNFV